MNATDQHSTDLDKMLSAFFKAEIPDPFPALKRPVGTFQSQMPMPVSSEPRQRPDRTALSKSRISLAASVALLLGGCWYLSSQIGNAPERPSVGKGDGGSAKVPKEIRKATESSKKSNMP
jgi:hypothetical protein